MQCPHGYYPPWLRMDFLYKNKKYFRCYKTAIPTQTHLTICSDTGLWNLDGKYSLGFTVKHWISEFGG